MANGGSVKYRSLGVKLQHMAKVKYGIKVDRKRIHTLSAPGKEILLLTREYDIYYRTFMYVNIVFSSQYCKIKCT
jgi:hypothetical protein